MLRLMTQELCYSVKICVSVYYSVQSHNSMNVIVLRPVTEGPCDSHDLVTQYIIVLTQ